PARRAETAGRAGLRAAGRTGRPRDRGGPRAGVIEPARPLPPTPLRRRAAARGAGARVGGAGGRLAAGRTAGAPGNDAARANPGRVALAARPVGGDND